jgi:hypothetical protein
MMLATSFGVGVRLGFFSVLNGVLVAVSAITVVTPATVRGRIGRERGRIRLGFSFCEMKWRESEK